MTLYSLTEQIISMIDPDSSNAKKFERSEIKRFAVQVMNGLLKTQHLTEEMSGGEVIPDGTILAEYDNIAVESYKNSARAELPAMPIKLPRGLGVFHISKTDDIFNGFIPFGAGELQMIGEEPLLSDILGQVGYEQRGKYIYFNKDITDNDAVYAINEVYMLLAVKDLSLYGDWDLLPISASMEFEVIQTTLQMLVEQIPASKKVDVITKDSEA